MLTLKVKLKDAEKTKKMLLSKGLLDVHFLPSKDRSFIYFPVKKRFSSSGLASKPVFVQKKVQNREERKSLKESLGSKLSKDELSILKSSMDQIGTIAILEIPKELVKRRKIIGRETLKVCKGVKGVFQKGKHEGVYRVQKLTWLAGEKTKEAVYKENNITLKLDVEKVYFSPRLSNDRKRVAGLVQPGEEVLVMFSGCGPYTCVIAKNTPALSVVGVEINPVGHDYAVENLKINKRENAEVFLGDVRNVVPSLKRKFDRILMPLPKNASEYLDVALAAAKKGATIHMYEFQNENETHKSIQAIKDACDKAGRKYTLLGIFKCGQNSPRAYRFCFDFKVE
ncbi:class I SAM-dependent methyltransferase family protein [Candidatus Woesearchaeota archaeon]|nr:class I SAM-dependent methyltransferase family protein [Candidatus Woesearchaeota archaeon]